jgi:regulator of RNase E activity RraA
MSSGFPRRPTGISASSFRFLSSSAYRAINSSVAIADGKKGIAGFVIDGCIRDLEEIMDFGIYVRGVQPKAQIEVEESKIREIEAGGDPWKEGIDAVLKDIDGDIVDGYAA